MSAEQDIEMSPAPAATETSAIAPALQRVTGWNADIGVFPFEESLIYAASSVVVVHNIEDDSQAFLHLQSPVAALGFSPSASFLDTSAPLSSATPLIAAGGVKQADQEFTELVVFKDFGREKGYGPFLYHLTDIEQVAFVADGSKLISIEKNASHTLCVWDLARLRRGVVIKEKPLWQVSGMQSALSVGAVGIRGITAMPVVDSSEKIINFHTLKYKQNNNPGNNVVDRSIRSESTANAVEQRYFYKVKSPGEKPPLRFITWGAQCGTRFYALDRRQPKLNLCCSKASFNCEELNVCNASIEHHSVTSCVVLSDGVHTLFGTTKGEIFFFEDAQALRVFTLNNIRAAPSAPIRALVNGAVSGTTEQSEVLIGDQYDVHRVYESAFYEEVTNHLSIRGPSATTKIATGTRPASSSRPGTARSAASSRPLTAQPLSKKPAALKRENIATISLGGVVSNPSVLVAGRKFEVNAFEVNEAEILVEKDRSPKKKVLRNMERRALIHRADAANLQSTINDKKYVTATKVVRKSKARTYDYLFASKGQLFLLNDGDAAAQVVATQPCQECTGICPLPAEAKSGEYAMGSTDGWVHFPKQVQDPIQIPGRFPVYSVAASNLVKPTRPTSVLPHYVAAGCANSKVFVFSLPSRDLVFSRSLGVAGDVNMTSCAFSVYNAIQKNYKLAVGGQDGVIFLLTLTNPAWTENPRCILANNPSLSIAQSGLKRATHASGTAVQQLRGHATAVTSLAFSDCGNFLLSGGYDGQKIAFETHTGQRLPSLSLVADLKFAPGRYFSKDGAGRGVEVTSSSAVSPSKPARGQPTTSSSSTSAKFAFAPSSRTAGSSSSSSGAVVVQQQNVNSKPGTTSLDLANYLHSSAVHHSVLQYNKKKLNLSSTYNQQQLAARRPTSSYTTLATAGKRPICPVSEKFSHGTTSAKIVTGGLGNKQAGRTKPAGPRTSSAVASKKTLEIELGSGGGGCISAGQGLVTFADGELAGISGCTSAISGEQGMVVSVAGAQHQMVYG
ncbi:unnamed protein product [Amoebophrya sp. A120]|nr:unnamed protein product [Amoebophrya sp. A120]|eukprot:GSA120T00015653001.1